MANHGIRIILPKPHASHVERLMHLAREVEEEIATVVGDGAIGPENAQPRAGVKGAKGIRASKKVSSLKVILARDIKKDSSRKAFRARDILERDISRQAKGIRVRVGPVAKLATSLASAKQELGLMVWDMRMHPKK